MECAHCHFNPLDAAKALKRALWGYRFALLALFLFLLWIAFYQPGRAVPEASKNDLVLTPPTQPPEKTLRSIFPSGNTSASSGSAKPANVVVLVDHDDANALAIFLGFKKHFRKPFETIDLKKISDYSRNNDVVFVAAGNNALQQLYDERLSQTQFFFSTQPNPAVIVDSRDHRYGVFAKIPEQYEWVALRQLMPDLKHLILVYKSGADKPKESAFKDWPYDVEIVSGSPAQLAATLAQIQPKDSLIWLQDFSNAELAATRWGPEIKSFISFQGIEGFGSVEKPERTPPLTYFSLRPNAEGLGKQGARLVNQYLSGKTIETIDQYPQEAFEVVLHLGGVAEGDTLGLISSFEDKVRALGFPVRYQTSE